MSPLPHRADRQSWPPPHLRGAGKEQHSLSRVEERACRDPVAIRSGVACTWRRQLNAQSSAIILGTARTVRATHIPISLPETPPSLKKADPYLRHGRLSDQRMK
jgi:hypothetical protein